MTGIGARCTCLAVPYLPVLACRLEGLQPDVLFGDGAVAPFRYGHHPAVAFHLPDHARPFSGPEPDRVRRDLRDLAAGGLQQGLSGIDVLLDAVGGRLPFAIY